MDLVSSIIRKHTNQLAFLIGNGINRYPDNPDSLSWDDLLMELWEMASFTTLSRRPTGVSMTEFYDLMEAECRQDINLQKEVVRRMGNWKPSPHHYQIMDSIRKMDRPVMTTNYDRTFAEAADCGLIRLREGISFTDYYPWSVCHGPDTISEPRSGFGIWYINGMIEYPRSIRLGLNHYMGSVAKAQNLINGTNGNLFGQHDMKWSGDRTWLDIFFHCHLFVLGIAMEENETFLRWLFIQRMKYFRKYPRRKKKSWYICTAAELESMGGKRFFLERTGFEVLAVPGYKDIYENIWK